MRDLTTIATPTFMDVLPERLQQKLIRAARLITYADGQIIHSRGDNKPGLSIIKTGTAHAGVYGADGSFVLTSILGPGQTFGEFTLFAGLPRTHDMSADGVTEIYQISAGKFSALYNDEQDISRALLSTSLIRSHLLIEIMDAMRRLPMRERTAKILLIMMQSTGGNPTFECRQSDLAFTLGVSRMSLSKAVKELVGLGLIETGYGEIKIPDTKKMSDWVTRHCSA